MVKQRGKGSKQPGRGDSSRGGKGKMIKLTPQVRESIKKTRKLIKAADKAASHSSGSEYVPSQDVSSDSIPNHVLDWPRRFRLTDDTPPPSPAVRQPINVVHESSEASLSGESAEGDEEEVQGAREGPNNPKDKNYKPPASAPTGQSDEPVAVELSTEPASTTVELPPGPFTTAAASSKLSTLSSTIAAQSASQPAQIPQSIEDTLKKILENQEKIISTQDALSKAVDSHDLLFGDPDPAAVPATEPQREQTQRLPRKKRKLPSADEAIIQLADPPEASSSQPHDAPNIQPVQPSSSPVAEATRCDTHIPETDEYIQEPDATVVTAAPTAPSTEPASLTDDHAADHPPIKRHRAEDYSDSVSGRDGMRLRPAPSSSPVAEATRCDTHIPETDEYIQEPDATVVTAAPTAPSTEPASLTDDHAADHPPIKRHRAEDYSDSVSGRDGMRLRPAAALKHKGCGTHYFFLIL
ncbi:PREDICTED: nascent polypeptide-associated complex subunit alpha, muscle-specific form-like [Nicotiana attenuata]|uniref:nascent polypeptide-associated complex subunit alpha, muscle-specific form-like n=1 Tax=Nicotiana attenuata TaxID=49451 RepID=UPI00090589A6|nr:PREDICTED: nascent polypeptide-associated complex subunit alpha, muscle-specific form-like [Nicotiana attenuata]